MNGSGNTAKMSEAEALMKMWLDDMADKQLFCFVQNGYVLRDYLACLIVLRVTPLG